MDHRTKWKKTLGFLLFFFLLASFAEAGLKDQVVETTLANGLKVILLENHKAPLITFQVWYRVGSRNEEWGKTGLSHMLEHMMFKGTAKVGPEEFSRIIQENGGNDNAFTSDDFTAYFENLSADRVQVSIDLESDRMQNLVLREEDFRTERMVVMEERRLRTNDNPQAFLLEQVEAAAFQVSPYHWPTIGWMEDIVRFTLDDLKNYYRTTRFSWSWGTSERKTSCPRLRRPLAPSHKEFRRIKKEIKILHKSENGACLSIKKPTFHISSWATMSPTSMIRTAMSWK